MESDIRTVVPRRAARDIPARRTGSIRRTSSIDMAWPDGRHGSVVMAGNARDVLTIDPANAPIVLVHDRLDVRVSPRKIIESITTDPPIAGIDGLIGESVLAGFRRRLRSIPAIADIDGRPLALLLDDLVGCNVISGWVWGKWITDRDELLRWSGNPQDMVGACVSYAPGASVFDGDSYLDRVDPVPPLEHVADPHALHPLAPDIPQTMRRVRVIDVHDAGDTIAITALFQDSGTIPGGRRSAVHEYALRATADTASATLLTLEATPGVLPHRECVTAPAGLSRLIGTPLDALRETVLRDLRGTAGCTHLNDAVRALAEASLLLRSHGNG